MPILGLLGTEQLAANRFTSIRRKVFYFYPNGAAPLMGLLSLLEEEQANDPEFSIFEKRLPEHKHLVEVDGGNVYLYAAGVAGSTAPGAVFAANAVLTAATNYCIRVDSIDRFRKGQIVRINAMALAAGGTSNFTFRVVDDPFVATGAPIGEDFIRVTPLITTPSIDFNGSNLNEVLIVGSAHRQGAVGSAEVPYEIPVTITNYLQIFRSSFSMTGTAKKTPVKYDETSAYRDKAKDAAVTNSREMEFAYIFGDRSKDVDPVSNLPLYTTGGVLWFLSQWELTAGNPYGATGATLDTDDNKRIIDNAAGTMSVKRYNDLLERLFRVTNNTVNEKLGLCGSGFLTTINEVYSDQTVFNTNLPFEATFGMDIVSHRTPFGTVFYKTHPLFSQNPVLRFNVLFLDVHNLRYRYMDGRDTQLLTERQENDADYRRDEWLGEAGLELRFPESHMYLQNVQEAV